MSDTKKEFPINEMPGYKHIRTQLLTSEAIAIYDTNNKELGVVIKSSLLPEKPFFYDASGKLLIIDLDQMQEIVRYMEFIKMFGVSVKFEDDSDDRIKESHA